MTRQMACLRPIENVQQKKSVCLILQDAQNDAENYSQKQSF